MKFTDLLLPKWKNSNPLIRLKAVKAIDRKNSELLEKILVNDDSVEIRLTALNKIDSETIIENTCRNDTDETVRRAASHRLNLIYSEKILDSDDLPECVALLNQISDEEVIAALSSKINSPDFRVNIVEKISNPELLCKIAESNCGVKAGIKIIDKTDELFFLERIAKKASSKKIRKKATDKINTQNTKTVDNSTISATQPDNTSAVIALCEEIESPIEENSLSDINNLIEKANKSREQTIKDSSPELTERFNNAFTNLTNHAAKLELIENTLKKLEDICLRAETISELPKISENEKQQMDTLCNNWSVLGDNLHDNTTVNLLNSKFQKYVFSFNENYKLLLIQKEREKETINNLKSILKATEDIINSENIIISEPEIISLKTKWGIEYIESEETIKIRDQFTEAIKKYDEIIANHKEVEKNRREDKCNSLLSFVKKASEEDNKKLYKLAPEVKNAIEEWEKEKFNVSDELEISEFQNLCNIFFDRLDSHNTNREWELWANLSLKNELCATVEKIASMAEKDESLSGYSKRIRDAQAKWKEIGPVAKNKSDEIWGKFKSSCDIVFSLCLNEKQRLLTEAGEAIKTTNFNEASDKIMKIQKAWKQIGSLPLSLEKDVRDSFTRLCDDFFSKKREFIQQKDLERQDNYTLKLSLCKKAETYIDSTEWNKTTEIYKQLQAEWKKTGPVPREKSDEIWERFSLACNTYFDNLEKTKPENMKTKTGFCEKAESVVNSIENGIDIWEACKIIINLQKQWNLTGPVPREYSDQLWERFRSSCDKIFEMREVAREKLSVDHEKNRKEKEILIHQAEVIVETPDLKSAADELKKIQEKWKIIGSASRKDEQALWTEFRKINDSFFNNRREQFQNREALRNNNLAIKENLCLNLELLAKILTDNSNIGYNEKVPLAEQLSIARELRQTVDIPGDKKATRDNIMKKVKELQKIWKETGAVPSELEKAIWSRYKKAGDLFYS